MMNNLTYRPEIEGLRTIAVLLVMAFHLNITGFSGGFIGVDMFFVISAYLMTRAMIAQLEAGTFRFVDFYQQGIKRLYPMLILIVGGVSFLAILLFDAQSFERLRQSAEFSALLAVNFYFATGQADLNLEATANPLWHLWLIAVLVQYYLFASLLIYVLYRFARRAMPWVLLGLAVLSLALNWIPASDGTYFVHRYYLSYLRFFEFLVGACLVYLPSDTERLQHRFVPFLAWMGLLVLLLCTIYYAPPSMSDLPSLSLCLPVLLTAMLIYLLQSQRGRLYRLLLHSLIVRIGLMSYSLYLWHWVFVAFGHYIFGQGAFEPLYRVVIVLATFILSWASYRWVEQTLHHFKCSFRYSLICLYFLPTCFVLGINYFAGLYLTLRDEQIYRDSVAVQTYLAPSFQVLSLGDSHNAHLAAFMQYVGEREGWHATMASMEACPFPVNKEGTPKADSDCQAILSLVKSYPVIYLSSYYSLYTAKDLPRTADQVKYLIPDYQEQFIAWVKYLSKTHQVFVFSETPMMSRSGMVQFRLSRLGLDRYISPVRTIGETDKMNQRLQSWIAGMPNVHYVDIDTYLPKDALFEGKPVFIDKDHLTPFGALLLGQRFHASGARILEVPK